MERLGTVLGIWAHPDDDIYLSSGLMAASVRDGGRVGDVMAAPLDEQGASQVREIMAEVDPDTVLTFGPEGMTGHRAHQDVSRWATDAFQEVAKPGARLLYATYTP